jgi:hypothetical protein
MRSDRQHVPSVTLRQLANFTALLDGEPSGTITSLEVFETIDWNSGRARGKLQQARLLLRVPTPNALPKVLNHFVVLSVSAVVGMLLPILDINVCNASNQQLKLALIKNVDQICRYEFVEATDEVLELLFDTFLNTPFRDESRNNPLVFLLGVRQTVYRDGPTRRIPSCSHS